MAGECMEGKGVPAILLKHVASMYIILDGYSPLET